MVENFKCLLLNSFNFYVQKYEIFTNPLLITAGFLNPQYRSFKKSTPNEQKDFFDISKQYLLKLAKDLNKLELKEKECISPSILTSNSSFRKIALKHQNQLT